MDKHGKTGSIGQEIKSYGGGKWLWRPTTEWVDMIKEQLTDD